MNRRTAGIVLGVLTVVCLVLVATLAYPFSTNEALSALPAEERFTLEGGEAYAVSVDTTAAGGHQEYHGILTAAGEQYEEYVGGDRTTTAYLPGPDGPTYTREVVEDDEAERRIEAIEDDDGRVLHDVVRREDGTTVIVSERAGNANAEPIDSAAIYVDPLGLTAFDRVEEADGVAVYEPSEGWYDEHGGYRITDASGSVQVDGETRTIRSAAVAWDVTEPAGSYAEYLRTQLTGDGSYRYEATIELDDGPQEIEVPEWVQTASDGSD